MTTYKILITQVRVMIHDPRDNLCNLHPKSSLATLDAARSLYDGAIELLIGSRSGGLLRSSTVDRILVSPFVIANRIILGRKAPCLLEYGFEEAHG